MTLTDASSWYELLFAQSAMGLTLVDGRRRVIDCNDAFCRILGHRREELLGRGVLEFSVPGDEDQGAAAMAALFSGASSFSWEKRYLRADGTTTWVRINLSLLSHSEKVFAATVEDINERRRTEAQLRDKMRLIARAHELAKIGPFVVDARARTIAVSGELARLLAAG